MRIQEGMLNLRRDWHLSCTIFECICIVFRLVMASEACENVWGLRKTVETGQSRGKAIFQPKVLDYVNLKCSRVILATFICAILKYLSKLDHYDFSSSMRASSHRWGPIPYWWTISYWQVLEESSSLSSVVYPQMSLPGSSGSFQTHDQTTHLSET